MLYFYIYIVVCTTLCECVHWENLIVCTMSLDSQWHAILVNQVLPEGLPREYLVPDTMSCWNRWELKCESSSGVVVLKLDHASESATRLLKCTSAGQGAWAGWRSCISNKCLGPAVACADPVRIRCSFSGCWTTRRCFPSGRGSLLDSSITPAGYAVWCAVFFPILAMSHVSRPSQEWTVTGVVV